MAYFLFVDESGHDQTESPHAVSAGLAVEDRDLWKIRIYLLPGGSSWMS
jgi:hypothetical protein